MTARYTLHLPAPPLRPYIEWYWFLDDPSSHGRIRETIPVDAKADLILNFGADYQRGAAAGAVETVAQSNIDAQRLYPMRIAQLGIIRLLGVRFLPGGLSAFVRLPMHELSGCVVSFESLFHAAARTLEAQLYDRWGDFPACAALLDVFLVRHLTPAGNHATIHRLLKHIDSDVTRSMQRIARDNGYSIRTIDRLFAQHIGLTPKTYAGIVRFQRALDALTRGWSAAAAAAHWGYYDQAHFNRAFKTYAGMTPGQFVAQLRTDE